MLYADVDAPGAVERLATLPPPSFTVASGGETDGVPNIHAYWRLDAPVSATSLKCGTKPLDAYLSGGTPHVYDATRILRIPGTVAYKYDGTDDAGIRHDDCRPIEFETETDVTYGCRRMWCKGLPDAGHGARKPVRQASSRASKMLALRISITTT